MTAATKIEWADSTFNPWSGCTKISPACDHCYAEALSKRAPKTIGQWGAGAPRRRTSAAYWKQPLRWNAERFAGCNECGHRGVPVKGATGWQCESCLHVNLSPQRRRVFCASLADVFDNEADPEWRAELFELIATTPHLDWLLLTKRIGNADQMMRIASTGARMWGAEWPLPNVWLGATICNQSEADRDIPKLLATPAAKRFLSIEPMLGPIDLTKVRQTVSPGYFGDCLTWDHRPHNGGAPLPAWPRLDWVICGGESGPGARPMHPDWVRSLRDQCAAAGGPFLFKQWGEWLPAKQTALHAPALMTQEQQLKHESQRRFVVEHNWPYWRLGKNNTGRKLDGREHTDFPA